MIQAKVGDILVRKRDGLTLEIVLIDGVYRYRCNCIPDDCITGWKNVGDLSDPLEPLNCRLNDDGWDLIESKSNNFKVIYDILKS